MTTVTSIDRGKLDERMSQLPERHVTFAGDEGVGALVDYGRFAFHCAQRCGLPRDQTPRVRLSSGWWSATSSSTSSPGRVRRAQLGLIRVTRGAGRACAACRATSPTEALRRA